MVVPTPGTGYLGGLCPCRKGLRGVGVPERGLCYEISPVGHKQNLSPCPGASKSKEFIQKRPRWHQRK